MSDPYVQRLRRIRDEFEAARQSLAYVNQNWDGQSLFATVLFQGISPNSLQNASRNVEVTYFVRLFAEFEGILKDHLQTNHSAAKVPAKPKVDELIALVLKQEQIRIDSKLRGRMNGVRDYRNAIAHSSYGFVAPILFNQALSTLNTFLSKLPDPL
jgi:hypothetical protein